MTTSYKISPKYVIRFFDEDNLSNNDIEFSITHDASTIVETIDELVDELGYKKTLHCESYKYKDSIPDDCPYLDLESIEDFRREADLDPYEIYKLEPVALTYEETKNLLKEPLEKIWEEVKATWQDRNKDSKYYKQYIKDKKIFDELKRKYKW